MLNSNDLLKDDKFCHFCKKNSLIEKYSYEVFKRTKDVKIKTYYSICSLCNNETITTNQIIKNENLIRLIKLLIDEIFIKN